MGKVKENFGWADYESIPAVVEDYIMGRADAMFITDIPLDEINDWAYNNVQTVFDLLRKPK